MKTLIFIKRKSPCLLLLFLTLAGMQCFSQTSCINNGIGVTVTGVFTGGMYSTPSATTVCTPNAAFTGAGAFTSTTGSIIYTFSTPVISATVTYSSANTTITTDVATIIINGGGALSITNPCGVSVSGGNVITCNLAGTVTNIYGNVAITVESTMPFTTITLTNSGASSGWGQGNPCNFLLCLSDATLSSPSNDVDNNMPSGNTLIERSNTISASNIIGVGNSNFQDGVVYHAGDFVELDLGFGALYGSQFSAYVEGCTADFTYRPAHTNQQPTASDGRALDPSVTEPVGYLRIHPNPSSRFITVEYAYDMKAISLTSMDGKTVLNRSLQGTVEDIDVSGFRQGVYLIVVETQDGQILQSKFVKN
jgi:hypothetical protein